MYLLLSISSIFFILGNYSTSKKLRKHIDISKKYDLIIFVIIVLLQSYFIYIINLIYPSSIIIYSKIIYYSSVLIGVIYSLKKIKKFKINLSFSNSMLIIVFLNLFLASIVFVTDADSVRYHLGQFNMFSFEKNFDLHSKISFIGDGINQIAFANNVYNITSLLSFFILSKCFYLISRKFNHKKKFVFFLLLFGLPIYLNQLISQKPYLWITISLFYFLFLNFFETRKNFHNSKKEVFLSLSFIFLVSISKPEFLIISSIIFIIYVYANFSRLRDFKYLLSIIVLFPFLLVNFFIYSDPLKIMILQSNIGDTKFLEFLSNSKVDFNLKNLSFFILHLGVPNNYLSNFSTSLGLGFFFLIYCFFLKQKNNYIFYIVILIFFSNLIFERISISENHARNYILIFYLLTLILIDNLNKFPEKLMITLLSFQLIITQISFVYFNYEIYIKKKYNEISYNLENENKINSIYAKKEDIVIITSLDGNLFKKYNFYNIDYFNFDKEFFYNIIKKNLIINKNKIKKVILIFKENENILNLENFKTNNILLSFRTRNPSKKLNQQNYEVYEVPINSFLNIINSF